MTAKDGVEYSNSNRSRNPSTLKSSTKNVTQLGAAKELLSLQYLVSFFDT